MASKINENILSLICHISLISIHFVAQWTGQLIDNHELKFRSNRQWPIRCCSLIELFFYRCSVSAISIASMFCEWNNLSVRSIVATVMHTHTQSHECNWGIQTRMNSFEMECQMRSSAFSFHSKLKK